MILLTGGSGLLGTEIQKRIKVYAPSSKKLDVTKPVEKKKRIDLVIHAAAYTDLVKAEGEDKDKCRLVNIVGTHNMVSAYKGTPFVYISTEYVRYPELNIYSLTKLIGELIVSKTTPSLIIRTLFKPNPFPHPRAFIDQYTQGDYVDIIAPMILEEIRQWDGKGNKITYVGTGRKTMFELASRTREVTHCLVSDIREVVLPKDYL